MEWFKNMNLPNKLTVIRICAIPIFDILVYKQGYVQVPASSHICSGSVN